MKILHINTHSHGGAFNGAYRLHIALLKAGVNSKMLVRDKPVNDNELQEVYSYNQTSKKTNVYNRLTTRLGFPVTAAQIRWNACKAKSGDFEVISFPITDYDITRSEYYKEADLIHLHWVANYVDYKSFFKNCSKPIVITLRDLFPIQGIFHYANDFERDKNQYGNIDSLMFKLKNKAITKSIVPKSVVGISAWITSESEKSDIHRNIKHQTIHNCIDINQFKLLNKDLLQKEFNINPDSIVLSFISDGTENHRKGLDLLSQAFSNLADPTNIIIFTAGRGIPKVFPNHIVHRHLGPLDTNGLNKLYSLSDAFIFPSREEALGNVMLEAMACGTPVIGTPVGGLLDVIKPGFNGLLSKDVSADGLMLAIEQFIEIRGCFDSHKIREYIKENFAEDLVASKYIQLYKELLNKQNTLLSRL